MNNILTFEDYRKMNIRQVESVIYHQFIEKIITEKAEVNEGFIRNAINKSAGKFIQNALADEIEKGKELEKSIKEALDGLNKGFEEIEKKIDTDGEPVKDPKSQLSTIDKVKEAIKAVQSQAFDTLTMIGSEGEIDFAGFLGSATVSAAANFGILFSPIRSVFITRKAYKYFLGIIKQTIRRNLLVIQLNFDQFENLILQKSFETEDDSEAATMRETLNGIINTMQMELIGKDSKLKFTGKKGKDMQTYLSNFQKTQTALIQQNKENYRSNPFRSLWEDQHNNTYTRTLEQIKQYINEDSQKELDALKNSITKMAGNDPDLLPYGELLISAAEEYAIHTNHGINNNFIKMSSVFNLDNQKKLIELITKTHEENIKEIEEKTNTEIEEFEDTIKDEKDRGREIYEELMKSDVETYSIDSFNEKYNADDLKALRAFLSSEEGKEPYKKLLEKNNIFKYILLLHGSINMLLDSFDILDVVEIPNSKDFYDTIITEDQALYYMMANTSLKDAIESVDSKDYFGFDITSDKVNDNILQSAPIEESNDFTSIYEGAQKAKRLTRLEDYVKTLEERIKELENKSKNAGEEDKEKYEEEIKKAEEEIENTEQEIEDTKEDSVNSDDIGDSDKDNGDSDNENGDSDKDGEDSDKDNKDSDGEDSDKDNGDSDNDDSGSDADNENTDKESKRPSDIDNILTKKLFPDNKTKKYFLIFEGDGKYLFNILHKDFKTEIFTGDTYVSDISIDRKLTIFKIFFENLGIGKDVAESFAKCLVRLEGHMLLKPKDSWFVVKNNTELIEKEQCFDKKSENIVNNNAFVEISQDEYKQFDEFLKKFHKLHEQDFDIEDN